MNKWNILDSNGNVLQRNIESCREAQRIAMYITNMHTRIVLEETEDQQKEYFDKLKEDKEVAKQIINKLVGFGLNKKVSCDSFTKFTKRGIKDLYSIKQYLENDYKCHISDNAIWLDDYVMDIRLEGTKIVFNF